MDDDALLAAESLSIDREGTQDPVSDPDEVYVRRHVIDWGDDED